MRARARSLLALLGPAALLLSSPLTAQQADPAQVRGRLVAGATGTPVPDAQVVLVGAAGRERRTSADRDGRFAVALPGPGSAVVRVRAIGYEPLDTLVPGAVDGLVLTLRKLELLPTVTVLGNTAAVPVGHPTASDLLTAVSVLPADQIVRESADFTQDLLRKVPGVYQADFNQGVVSGDIGIRGFNTESDISSVKLLIDGIPTNTNAGLAEINMVFPWEIETIEVVRGTNDARFGLFNLAGNMQVTTRRGGTFLQARTLAGSFGSVEAAAVGGLERGGFSQTYSVNYRRGSGYRANSDFDRYGGSAKFFWTSPSRRLVLGATGRFQDLDTQAPGYLTLAESRTAPRSSPAFAAADGGSIRNRQVALHAEYRASDELFVSLRSYGTWFDRVRYVRFTAAGAQQERIEDERQLGAIAELTWRPAALAAQRAVLHAGVDGQTQANIAQRYRTVARVREATLRDFDFGLRNGGGFVQGDITLGRRVRLGAGLRLDRFGGDFRNRVASTTAPLLRYGWIPQPKASATVTLAEGLSVYGNWGRSFQIGVGAGAYGTQPLTWSRNDGWEAGAVTALGRVVQLRAAAWRQDASDEVRLRFDNSGDSENVGRTRRFGFDVEATARPTPAVTLWGAITSQRARLVEPGPRAPQQRGNLLDHVPNWTAKYGVDVRPGGALSLSAWAFGQGDYFLTNDNVAPKYGGYTAVNADASLALGRIDLSVGIQNAFGTYYEYVFFDGTQSLHSPAPGRTVFASTSVRW